MKVLFESSFVTTLLQKCAAVTSLRRARQLHALLLTSNPNPMESTFIHNNIMSMYARCGSLQDSQQLFDKMRRRSIISYNTLISTYSRTSQYENLAFVLFNELEYEGLLPNGLTMTSLLQASAGLRDFVVGTSVHAHCLRLGFLNNVRVGTSLIGMYSSCGDVNSADKVFSSMRDRDAVSWNTIISCYLKNGRGIASLQIFRNMLKTEVKPTQFTYSLILNGCAKLEDYVSGKLVHAQVVVSGTCVDLPLQNSLLDMYCSCGDTQTAFNLFSRIEHPDLVSWNSMILGFSENGYGEMSMKLFIRLARVSPFKPDEFTFAAVIYGTAGFSAPECGKLLHGQTEKSGYAESLYIGSTLISMYFSNGDSVSSKKVFDSLLHKDEVVWTDMVAGYVKIGESEVALKCFLEMVQKRCNLDSFIISSALSACADLVALRQGEMIHSLSVKTGNESEMCVHGSLVDMYAKNGELKSAGYIFSCLPNPDLKCWNSILTGYGNHGQAKSAFQIYDEMLKIGLKVDQVTFLSLLAACNHCGLVEKGRFFWNSMKDIGLRPGIKHYSCMINLLSRARLWEEVEEILIESESQYFDDYLEIWRTVLGSCVENGNIRMGIHVAERILKSNMEDSAVNILAMKLYAAAGRWEDVSSLKRNTKRLMLDKNPGLSWIDI